MCLKNVAHKLIKMQKLLFLQIILLPFLSFSQELFTSSELLIEEGLKSKQGRYLKMSDYVIIFSDYSSEELYNKTTIWFNDNFNQNGDKIQNKSFGKYISFHGSTKELLKTHKAINTTKGYDGYKYIIEVKFKYGRLRFEPVSLKTYTKDESSLSGGWYERGFSNKILDYDGNEIEEGNIDINTQVDFFNKLAISLNQFLNGENNIKVEEW